MCLSSIFRPLLAVVMITGIPVFAADDYPPHPDSIVQAGVAKGELVKGTYVAKEHSVFPGTGRDYQIYLPAGFDKSKPAPFMVFQDGVIYNAPVVFDNLIAKHELPPLVGIFIKPGVVPAANPDALPRFNRSYEYDSVSDTYSKFLIDEFLPAIAEKLGLKLSTDPNDAATCGNSSGGICAFMTAWHRPDRFRRVFSGVGTYVGIHGADQLSVLVRKMEPKPLRVYLQSGEQDNNLYCGDWWMANQMMERSLTWAGYDVNHTWGTGGHNGKQATAIFPDVLRWLWKGWPEAKEIKANPRGDSKWLGYQVLGVGTEWEEAMESDGVDRIDVIRAVASGEIYGINTGGKPFSVVKLDKDRRAGRVTDAENGNIHAFAPGRDGCIFFSRDAGKGDDYHTEIIQADANGKEKILGTLDGAMVTHMVATADGTLFIEKSEGIYSLSKGTLKLLLPHGAGNYFGGDAGIGLSPDQTLLYACSDYSPYVWCYQILPDGSLQHGQNYFLLEPSFQGPGLHQIPVGMGGFCVDTEGRLYVATSLGIQVCDQAGRVNFIIPTPKPPHDVCFGGKDLGELFIACGDKIYKRPTKVHGIVSGQMAPVKPAPPKL